MIPLAGLAVFSGFSLNLFLSCALGVAGVAGETAPKGGIKNQLPFFQFGVLSVSVLILYILFGYILPASWFGFLAYFLFFPLSALSCLGLEFLGKRFLPKQAGFMKMFSALTAYDGLVPASLIITFQMALNLLDALILTIFFVLGIMVSMLILNEIRRRSAFERVPRHLRGSPIIFISMGLLSLISVSVAGICFRILEGFP